MKPEDIEPGKPYGCKFKTVTMLDEFGRPPGLSDVPLKGPGEYEGFGFIEIRDLEGRKFKIKDEKSKKYFIVDFEDVWDIDTVEWAQEDE